VAQNPYRPDAGSRDELERLAREGQARLRAAHSHDAWMASATAEANLRTALGPVRGAPMRRAVLVLLVLSVPVAIASLVLTAVIDDLIGLGARIQLTMACFGASIGLLCLYLFMAPKASRAGVEAERAWLASLPFPLEWYFELLASDPHASSRVKVELWWQAEGIDLRTLEGLVALMDTGAQVLEIQAGYAAFATQPLSGSTGIRVNRRNVYRNHRLGLAVHRVVDVVLAPIHRSAPLARVKLSRTF
jgi:hypothetical protein